MAAILLRNSIMFAFLARHIRKTKKKKLVLVQSTSNQRSKKTRVFKKNILYICDVPGENK